FLWLQHCSYLTSASRADAGGLSLHHQPILRHRIMGKNLALEDPALDADDPVGGQRLGFGIVHIGPQRVQRHPTFAIPFHTRDFSAAKTAAARNLDTFRAETKGGLHRALHGAAEGHAANELVRNALSDELRVDLRLANFDDIELHFALGHRCQFGPQLFDVRALLADDDARTRGIDRYAAQLGRTLDHHLGDRRLRQVLHDVLAHPHIFGEQAAVIAAFRIPAAVPGAIDLQAKPD